MPRSLADRAALPHQTLPGGFGTLLAVLLMLAVLAAAIAGLTLLTTGARLMDDPTALLFATG